MARKEKGERRKLETNEIFIGNKPFMKYVIATIMQLKENKNEEDTAIIKARGKFISRAVDVAEVVKKKFKETENIELKNSVTIGTEGFTSEEAKKINISTIEITLKK
ncbi:DNA/RNA-binding protein AlbA [Candidatus Pacearchaeota archaeon]|nr:DNA/RNA-binding protein AlbA [Candidatus Pacearchaeota archaeon]